MLMSINGAAWGDFPIDMTALSPDRIDKSRLKSIDNEPKVSQLQSDNNINPLIYDLFYQYNTNHRFPNNGIHHDFLPLLSLVRNQ